MSNSEKDPLEVLNAYLEEIKKKRSEALVLQENLSSNQFTRETQQAKERRQERERAANKDYMDYINPYGVAFEQMADRGINNSGITQSNTSRAYSAYANALAAAGSDYSREISDINSSAYENQTKLLASEYELEAQYLSQMADEASQNYWKTRQEEYQARRDAIEDERFERQWAYKIGDSSGQKTSSKKSSASSGSTYKESNNVSAKSHTIIPVGQSLEASVERAAQLSLAMTAQATYNLLYKRARVLTEEGSKAASLKEAKEILAIAQKSYLSQEQINNLSAILANKAK